MKLYMINGVLHKDSCKKCINALNCFTSYTDYDSFEACVKDSNIKRACKCCQKQYEAEYAYYLENRKFDTVYEYAKRRCSDMNYDCEVLDTGDIAIKTNVERWILSISNIEDTGIFNCTLYHKNNVNYRKTEKCKCTQYPEYHVQYTKIATVDEILLYVSKHEQTKWGVKTPSYVVQYNKSSVLA